MPIPAVSNPYGSRTHAYVAGDQVNAADLNAIQDGLIAVGAALSALVTSVNDYMQESRTATCNTTDSPAPSNGGAKAVWVEKSTNGTTEVVLDTSISWEDRYIIILGSFTTAAADLPGGASDNAIVEDLADEGAGSSTNMHGMFYSRDGQDGTSANEAYNNTISGGNVVRFYARSTDGALCMKRTTAGTDYFFRGEIRCSPDQGHYA